MVLNQVKGKSRINIGIVDDDPAFIHLLSKVLADYKEVDFNLLFVIIL